MDIQQRGDRGQEDVLMRLKQGAYGEYVLFKRLQMSPPPRREGDLDGGGCFLGNSVVCAGKQMLPTIAALQKN